MAQGFLFARPMPPAALLAALTTERIATYIEQIDTTVA
jgi:hypothetical protein